MGSEELKSYNIYLRDPISRDSIFVLPNYQSADLEDLITDCALLFSQFFPHAMDCSIEAYEIADDEIHEEPVKSWCPTCGMQTLGVWYIDTLVCSKCKGIK